MATALGELFISISANTGKFDAAMASSKGKIEGLSSQFGRTRDDHGRFVSAVSAGATAMAGHYVDSRGRMRSADGKYVSNVQKIAAAVATIPIRPPTVPPPSLSAWLAGIRQAARSYEGFIGPAFARAFAAMKAGLADPAGAFRTTLVPAALAAARGVSDAFARAYVSMRTGMAPTVRAFATAVPAAASAARAVRDSFAFVFASMRSGLGVRLNAFSATMVPAAEAAGRGVVAAFARISEPIRAVLGFPARAFLSVAQPAAAAARAVGDSFAFVFASMRSGLAGPTRAFLNLVGPTVLSSIAAVGREFTGVGRILGAVFGPVAARAGAAMRGAFAGAFSGLGGGLGRSLAGVGGLFTNVLGPAASRAASAMSSAFGGALRGVRATIGGIASGVGAIGSTFTSVLGRLKFPALAGAAAGLGAIGFAVKSAADLEQSFSQLRKTTGLTGPDLAKLQDELKTMGVTMSGVSFNDLTGIASMGGRMGIGKEELSQFTRDIAFVSIALDDIPAEESATKIARILNVFGLTSASALGFASALNKLDDSSTATGRDILDVASRIAPTAATLGLAPAKVLAIAAALKDAGAENEVAGSAISQIFGLMAKDIDAFAQVAGVSTAKFTEALRGDPLVALQLLIGNIQKMDKIDAFSQISTLGIDGVRATATLLQLSKVMDKLGGFVTVATEEEQSHASILAEVAIQGETTYAILKRLGNVVQIVAAEIGGFALPLVKALADSFGELGAGVREFIAGKAEGIAGFMAPLVEGARNVGLLFSEWPTFVALAGVSMEILARQVFAVLGRIGSGAWEGLTSGGAIAVRFLSNAFGAFGSFLADLFTQIAANLKAQFEALTDDMLGTLSGRAGDIARTLGTAGLAALPGGLGGVIKGLSGLNLEPPKVPVIPPIKANLDLVSPDKFTAGLPAMKSLGDLFGGVFKGLDAGTLAPDLAAEQDNLRANLARARAAKDAANAVDLARVMGEDKRRPFFEVPGKPLLAPGLDPAARAALGLDGGIPGLADALRRANASPRGRAQARAARAAAKRKKAADLAALSPAERRRKAAEAAAKARAAALVAKRGFSPKAATGAVDVLEEVRNYLGEILKVNESTDGQLKKGLIARVS